MQTVLQIQSFFDNGNQHIHRNSNPNLGSDRVFRGAIESFDPQMLFDPSKEQFHLPTTPIELSDRESGQKKIVGEKHQPFLTGNVVVAHSAKPLGIAALGNGVVEYDNLIALQTALFVHSLGVHASTVESFFGPSHKERSRLMHTVEPSKIDVGAVHQLNGAGLPDQLIEDVDLVDLSTRDNDHGGNTAAKIEQGV